VEGGAPTLDFGPLIRELLGGPTVEEEQAEVDANCGENNVVKSIIHLPLSRF
jgi:hypothetical protein